MTAQQVHQLLSTPPPAGDRRPGEAQNRLAADMVEPVIQAKLTP